MHTICVFACVCLHTAIGHSASRSLPPLTAGCCNSYVLTTSKGRTIDSIPALSCFMMKFSSANFAPAKAIHISIQVLLERTGVGNLLGLSYVSALLTHCKCLRGWLTIDAFPSSPISLCEVSPCMLCKAMRPSSLKLQRPAS